MKTNVERVVSWRRRTKLKLIIYKGGKCEECGYSKLQYTNVFCFHHLDPNEKEFGISARSYSFENLKKEVDKCQLLCQNCHAEKHQNLEPITLIHKKKKQKFKCPSCQKEAIATHIRQKYCSGTCAKIAARKVKNRPSLEELEDMIKTMSYRQIGKKYGVSDNSIKKWVKSAQSGKLVQSG